MNQGRLQRAHDLVEQFCPEITTPGQARLWFSLHIHYGFTHDDVTRSLDLLDRWPDDAEFAGQVLAGLYAAEGLRTPDGGSVLPALEPATVQRLQDRFTSYSAANPDGPIQLVDADPRQLVDMFRAQYTAMAQNAQSIIRHIHAGQATVGALAAFIRKPYARVLLQRGCDMIPAVTPDLAPFGAELDAAQSALDHAVVIETSAVVVATTLPGRWPQLRGAFTELRMTRDAWNDIQESRDVLRDPGTTLFLGYEPSGRARIDPGLTGDAHEQLSRRFTGIGHAMEDLTLIGTPDLGSLARFTFGGADPALSPLAACAASGTILWSDDIAIRSLAAQHGVRAFGTLALLHTLTEMGRIPDTMREDVLTLARGFVTDLMLTAEELASLAEEDHYMPGPAMLIIGRPLYWAIPDAGQAQFLELAGNVNRHNPERLTAWVRAACAGLAARHAGEPADHRAAALAEAVADMIGASNDIRTGLIEAAREAAQNATPGSPHDP